MVATAANPSPTLQSALEIGRHVLDTVYGGDVGREGAGSLRKTAPLYGMSTSTLYRYVAVAQMLREAGEPHLVHLGISHLRELLPLPPLQRRKLLLQAEAERWTVSRTRKECGSYDRRGIQRAAPSLRAAVGHLDRFVALRAAASDPQRLPPGEAESLLRTLAAAREHLDLIEHRLKGLTA